MYKDALAKATFDDEGAATYAKNVIENGKFTTFLHNLATAAKAGVKTTGNGYKGSYASTVGINHYSFYINPVKGSLEDLFAEAGNGIYITSVKGLRGPLEKPKAKKGFRAKLQDSYKKANEQLKAEKANFKLFEDLL